MDSVSPPPVVVFQITHYTQDIHYNIPSDQVIHNSPSGYMDILSVVGYLENHHRGG